MLLVRQKAIGWSKSNRQHKIQVGELFAEDDACAKVLVMVVAGLKAHPTRVVLPLCADPLSCPMQPPHMRMLLPCAFQNRAAVRLNQAHNDG
jgi:hypothetical protein